MKTKLFVSLILFFICIYCFSQKPIRVEIEAKSNSDSYKIIPFGKKGVVLFYQSNEKEDKQTYKWYFSFYDTNFKEIWNKQIPIMNNWEYNNFDYDDNYVYLLFSSQKIREKKFPFLILKVNVSTNEIQTINSEIPSKCDIYEFKVNNGLAYLGGKTLPKGSESCLQSCFSLTLIPAIFGTSIYKIQPVVFLIDLKTSQTFYTSTIYKGNSYVDAIQLSKNQKNPNVIIKNNISRKQNILYINEYDASGNISKSVQITGEKGKRHLKTGRILNVNNFEKLVIGTYNFGKKSNDDEERSDESSGLFFVKLLNDNQQFVKYYNFSQFKNLFNSFNKRDSIKMAEKIKKEQKKGKEPSFNYKLLVHDIIIKNNQYILIAEAYYPEYHTVYYTSFDYYGRPYTSSYVVFDGYRYTNAIVAGFDSEGNLIWDNSFEIKDILTFNLKERVKVLLDNNDIVLVYSSEGKIASKIIRQNKVIEGVEYTKIQSKYEKDKLISDYNSDIDFWYDNYFISYGYQKIKNRDQLKNNKRTVFYFNKIAFQ